MQKRKSKYNPPSRFNRIASGILFAFTMGVGGPIICSVFAIDYFIRLVSRWFTFAWRNGEVDTRDIDAFASNARIDNIPLKKRLSAVFLTSLMTIAILIFIIIVSPVFPAFCAYFGFYEGMKSGLVGGYKDFITNAPMPYANGMSRYKLFKMGGKPIESLVEGIFFAIVFIPLFPVISAVRLTANLLALPYKIYQNGFARSAKNIFNHLFDFIISPVDGLVLGLHRGYRGLLSYLNYKPLQHFRYSTHIHKDELDLSHRHISIRDIPYIIELLNHHPEIKKINLRGNNLGDEGAKLFIKLNKTATNVNLSENNISAQGAHDIAIHNKIVTILDLSGNNIGPLGAKNFATANQCVTILNIQKNNIGDEGAKNFAKANQVVTILNMSENQINAVGARDFAFANEVVKTLDISKNKLGDEGAGDFAAANKIVTNVNLSVNLIRKDGMINFAKNNTVITSADFSSNQIENDGAIGFAKHNTVTTTLNLAGCGLDSEGASEFAKFNNTVTHINFEANHFGTTGATGFASNNNKIITVNLSRTGLSAEGAELFAANNKTATTVILRSNNIRNGIVGFADLNTVAKSVDFGDNAINTAALREFFTRNKVITKIGLGCNTSLKSEGAKIIAQLNTIADEIDLEYCWIGEEGAIALLENSKVYTKYNLEENYNIPKHLLNEFEDANISREVLFTSSVALAAEKLKKSEKLGKDKKLENDEIRTGIYALLPEILEFAGADIALKNKNNLSAKLPKSKFFKANITQKFPAGAKEAVISEAKPIENISCNG